MSINLIHLLVLLTSIPAGIVLAKLTKEELKSGRSWFESLTILAFVAGFVFLMSKNYVVALSFFYISIVSIISLLLSHGRIF